MVCQLWQRWVDIFQRGEDENNLSGRLNGRINVLRARPYYYSTRLSCKARTIVPTSSYSAYLPLNWQRTSANPDTLREIAFLSARFSTRIRRQWFWLSIRSPQTIVLSGIKSPCPKKKKKRKKKKKSLELLLTVPMEKFS